jgi:hypothetical protein
MYHRRKIAKIVVHRSTTDVLSSARGLAPAFLAHYRRAWTLDLGWLRAGRSWVMVVPVDGLADPDLLRLNYVPLPNLGYLGETMFAAPPVHRSGRIVLCRGSQV